jgi:hypothetical protein
LAFATGIRTSVRFDRGKRDDRQRPLETGSKRNRRNLSDSAVIRSGCGGELSLALDPKESNMVRCRRPLILASVVAAAACALLAAGCGGGNSPGVATGSTTTNAAGPSAGASTHATGLVAFASCMRSHGVPNFPDPTSSGGIPKPAVVSAFQAVSKSQGDGAQNACNHLVPAGGLGGQPVETITPQDRQDYLKAAACMRSHGFPDFPDPTFQNTSAQVNIPSSINQNSSQFTSAATICTKLIPAGLPGTHRGNP